MRGSGEAEPSGLHYIKLFGVRAEWQRADRQASASQLRRARRCLRLDAPGAAAAAGAERSGGAEELLAARAAADGERLESRRRGQAGASAGPARRCQCLPSSPP